MIIKKVCVAACAIGFFLACFSPAVAQIKLKVTTDGTPLMSGPSFSKETKYPLRVGTILTLVAKEGDEWYRVSVVIEGQTITGYVWIEGVTEVSEEELAQTAAMPLVSDLDQGKLVRQIESELRRSRNMVTRTNELEGTIGVLRGLLAWSFRIADFSVRSKGATEIYYWISVAYSKLGDFNHALEEMTNMFQVSEGYANEFASFITDEDLQSIFALAKLKYNDLIPGFSFEIETDPSGALVSVDGNELGPSPKLHHSPVPQFEIEIRKEGYESVKEKIIMTGISATKRFPLKRIGKNLGIESTPEGAKVFLDEEDTGKVTDCLLEYVPFGRHKLRIALENYIAWESEVLVEADDELNQVVNVSLTPGEYDVIRKLEGGQGGEFKAPTDLAFDRQGNFYVIDQSKPKVRKFDAAGRALPNWKISIRGAPGFKAPSGIAVSGDGNLYITDLERNSLYKLSNTGQFIIRVGGEGDGPKKFRLPYGVAINSRSEVHVADSGNHCIKVFSHTLQPIRTIGKQANQAANLRRPVALTINSSDEIFVLDNEGVHKYSADGQPVASWGKIGADENKMKSPKGICVDTFGFLYVVDSGNHRFLKFDPSGNFLMQWGSYGSGQKQFKSPNALSLYSLDKVFVVDRDNNRILLLQVPGDKN